MDKNKHIISIEPEQSELKHFGILGMKWGVRKRGPASSDHTTAHTLKKKHPSELTNDDIKKVVTRLQLEKQLRDLNPKTTSFGQKLFGQMLSKFGPQILNSFLKRYTKVDFNDPFGANSPFDTSGAQDGQVIDLKFLKDNN